MAERFKFRYVNEFIGTLLIVVVILAVISVFLVARSQKWFEQNYDLKVLLPVSGSHGLREGAEVQLLGTVAGEVKSIRINKDDRMEAHLNIRADFFRFVRDDSVAVIRKKFGLVAQDVYLDISRGSGGSVPQKGALIPCSVEKDIITTVEETLARLEGATLSTIQEYRKLAADFGNPDSPLQLLLERMSRISESLEAGEGIAAKLLTDKSFTAELEKTLTSVNSVLSGLMVVLKDAQNTSNKIAHLTDNVSEQLAAMPRISALTEKVLQETQVVLQDIHKTVSSFPNVVGRLDEEMQSLPGLIMQTEETLRQIEKLVLGMQKHWLLREYVEQQRPATRIPSAEVGLERKLP
jgi:phospholipid/cholesterol/gamma-HCH transport system substrate-binding protein